MKRGKKYSDALENIDRRERYPLEKAVSLVKENSYANFDETFEISMNLNVDPRYSDQNIRGATGLPNGLGKEVTVLVFAQGEKIKEAEEAGADYVGEEYIEKVEDGWLDFDVVIATPDMMENVGKLGPILGPRGLMPSPKTGTVTFDLESTIKEVKAGRVEYKVDKSGNIHAPLGKVSFTEEDLIENALYFIDVIHKARPDAVKGKYIQTITLSTTMGVGVKVDVVKTISKTTE